MEEVELELWFGDEVPSARQEAMNSWRRGFIRCRIREWPIGSHQELARAEKWESSSAETEDVECARIWGVWFDGVDADAESKCFAEGLVEWRAERRIRTDMGRVRDLREAIVWVMVLVVGEI